MRGKAHLAAIVCAALATLIAPASSLAEASSTPDVFQTRCQLATKWTALDPILEQDPTAMPHVHSHDFFGATAVESTTTSPQLIASDVEDGTSSCLSTNFTSPSSAGDEFDGAAYWAPTLHLITTSGADRPVTPAYMYVYYQRVWNTQTSAGVHMTHVKSLPENTRMVAGSASGAVPPYVNKWICLNDGSPQLHRSGLPRCEGATANSRIAARINFPYCLSNRVSDWATMYGGAKAYAEDATHPAPSNAQTNVAYPDIAGGTSSCPAGFDTELPRLFVTVVYPYSGTEPGIAWERTYAEGGAYLGGGSGGGSGSSEQRMPLANMHADFMNGWVKSRPAPPSPLANDTCVKGDGGTVPCGLNGLIAQCLNTKNEVGEFAQGLPGTGCGLIRSTRP